MKLSISRLVGFLSDLDPSYANPTPGMQAINKLLQQQPYQILIYGVFWFFFLMIVPPLAGNVLLIVSLVRAALFYAGQTHQTVDVKDERYELAVAVTGCDTGFGQAVAIHLAERGFHVFAGCLKQDSFGQFKKNDNITPIKHDVCSDKDSADFAKAVNNWVEGKATSSLSSNSASTSKKRFLHALINNAGVGIMGPIDLVTMKDFEFVMNVNLFGMVRTTKAFLSIFKRQAQHIATSSKKMNKPRIINITSAAGMSWMPYGSPYFCSKHAAEAFSNVLRLEMRDFDIPVVTVNPSFHSTPLTTDMAHQVKTGIWDPLPTQTKEEYGEAFFQAGPTKMSKLPERVMWDAEMVTEKLTEAVELVRPPAKIMVGLDAQFGVPILRLLPPWLADQFTPDFGVVPAMMKPKPTTTSGNKNENKKKGSGTSRKED